MAEYSSILLEKAVDELSKLPGVGKKTALRLALHLLGEEKLRTEQLCKSLSNMRNNIVLCKRCYIYVRKRSQSWSKGRKNIG